MAPFKFDFLTQILAANNLKGGCSGPSNAQKSGSWDIAQHPTN
jgi:hypothetical protein